MAKSPQRPKRVTGFKNQPDLGLIEANKYNEAAGADKVIIVKPAVEKVVPADTPVGAGRLLMLTAAGPYILKCLGKDYVPANKYNFGDIAVSGGKVYLCNQDNTTGTFDPEKWRAVADAQVPGIPAAIGDVVATGRYHNAISVASLLVEEDSKIDWRSQRD